MRYEYEELKNKALDISATQEDLTALGDWFGLYGSMFWDGESYEVEGDTRLYPIYLVKGEDDYDVIGYTFSSSFDDRFCFPEERS